MIDRPPESRFAGLLKPFFDSIDPLRSSQSRISCALEENFAIGATAWWIGEEPFL
jgi:hypothetical protein